MIGRTVIDQDILPLFVIDDRRPPYPVSFEGTGFLIADHVLVTCRHCVARQLGVGEQLAAIRRTEAGYDAHPLRNISPDPSGADLATATVSLKQNVKLSLAEDDLPAGEDIWTFGYPLTSPKRPIPGGKQFGLNVRFLQGYVVRSFLYEPPAGGRIASYELDMMAPAGLSGAPVVRRGTNQVYGVVYGTATVSQLEELASVDPDSGVRTPELHRMVTFALAHYTATLRELRTDSTGGLPLAEFLRSQSRPSA